MSSLTERPHDKQRLGDFEITRELGRGGMGVVYEARQLSLNRKVALKVLAGSLGLTPKAIERFHREAEAAGKLHHTNIVPIYATGAQDGQHYYAMELIEGPSLDRVLRHLRTPAREGSTTLASDDGKAGELPAWVAQTVDFVAKPDTAKTTTAGETVSSSSLSSGSGYFDAAARMVAAVADALEHAHTQGVIHRDIKPSNLLLSPDGRLSINDFGLARMLEQPGMTMTGEFVGTPAYMSPEQITAGRTPLDHRTDVYSLGATLYEMLTLRPPFTGERRDQVLAQIIHKEAAPPRKVNARIPVDLETICLKALDKDPDKRYQTAGEFAEDLRRYLNRFAISARRAGPIERLKKWVGRHPALASALALAFVAVVTAGILGYLLHMKEKRAREEQIRALLEKALMLTTAADLDGAQKAINEAELLGASTAQLRMLKGQVALYRHEFEDAVAHLEQAVNLEKRDGTETVAARALLANAYLGVGRFDLFETTVTEMMQLRPTTAEDFLHRGRTLGFFDPDQARESIEEAVRLKPGSALATIRHAEVLADCINLRADPALAKRAMEDAQAGKRLSGSNATALHASAYAHLAAAAAFRAKNDAANAREAQKIGEADVQALIRLVEKMPESAFDCGFFLQFLNMDKEALDVLERAYKKKQTAVTLQALACTLYRHKRFGDAAAALTAYRKEKGAHPALDYSLAFILPEVEGPDSALAFYQTLARPKGAAAQQHICVLWLLGKRDLAREAFESELTTDTRWRVYGEFSKSLLAFGAGKMKAEDLLKEAGSSMWYRSLAHYLIALDKLSQGDRAGARDEFKKCLDTDNMFADEMWWSRAFYERLRDDETWPKWIPAR